MDFSNINNRIYVVVFENSKVRLCVAMFDSAFIGYANAYAGASKPSDPSYASAH